MALNLKARLKKNLILSLPAFMLASLVSGCATPPPRSDTADYQAYKQLNDPLEPTNRAFFAVNNTLDTYLMRPLAQGYVAVTTMGIRRHVGYFTSNIGGPARMLNFMASGDPKEAGTALVRFVLNSTIGLGGIFDPASALGYTKTDTDFGMTLASWGMQPGAYLYLPIFGPSGARDVLNLPVEWVATPMEAAPESGALNAFGYGETGLNIVNTYAGYMPVLDQINATALDPYATFRSLYRQSRASEFEQIKQGDTTTWPSWYHKTTN